MMFEEQPNDEASVGDWSASDPAAGDATTEATLTHEELADPSRLLDVQARVERCLVSRN